MRIVIVGTGFAGLTACMHLKNKLTNDEHDLIVISDCDYFLFRPSLIWVPFAERELDEISIPLQPLFQKHGIPFIQKKVEKISPKSQTIYLEENEAVHYDYLIIATGATLDFSAIPGNISFYPSFYTMDSALDVRKRLTSLKDNANIVIGCCPKNPNPLPSYEFTFELHAYFLKLRKQVNIHYFTYEETLASFYPDKLQKTMKNLFHDRNIPYYTSTKVESVTDRHIVLANKIKLPYDELFVLPPYKGASFLFHSGIPHENGLVKVDESMQSIEWKNIFVVGDSSLLSVKQKLKSGRAAELQGKIAAENVWERIHGRAKTLYYKDELMSIMETGTAGGMMVIEHSPFQIKLSGPLFHYLKLLFEAYYLQKIESFRP